MNSLKTEQLLRIKQTTYNQPPSKIDLSLFPNASIVMTYNILGKSISDRRDSPYQEHARWKNRKKAVTDIIQNNLSLGLAHESNTIKLPCILLFQEANIDQAFDLQQQLDQNLSFISYSNKTGEELAEIAKYPKSRDPFFYGFTNTIAFNHHFWRLEDKPVIEWISETPKTPSPTPGSQRATYHTILAVPLRNKAGNNCIFINVHMSYVEACQPYSIIKIVDFIRRVTDFGKKAFILGGDLNTFSQTTGPDIYQAIMHSDLPIKDWRDNKDSKIYCPNFIAHTTFIGFHGDVYKTAYSIEQKQFSANILDHIFVHQDISIIQGCKDPGTINPQCNKLVNFNDKETTHAACTQRTFASDHVALFAAFSL